MYKCKAGNAGLDQQNEQFRFASEAYKINPKDAGIVEDIINYYEVNYNKPLCTRYYRELDNLGRFDFSMLEYNFNMLMSVEKNAILLTGGDNDTYPARFLQTVKNIRPDITIINIYLASCPTEYLSARLKEKNILTNVKKPKDLKRENIDRFIKDLVIGIRKKYPFVPIYIASTAGLEEQFPDSLYSTGLAFAYSEKKMDNLNLLKNNVEQKFHLDYLRPDFYYDTKTDRVPGCMRSNYIAPFGMLYRYCKTAGKPSERLAFYRQFFLTEAQKMNPGESKEHLVKYLETGK